MKFPYGPNEEWEACCEREREEEERNNQPVPPWRTSDTIGFFAFIVFITWAGVQLVDILLGIFHH